MTPEILANMLKVTNRLKALLEKPLPDNAAWQAMVRINIETLSACVPSDW